MEWNWAHVHVALNHIPIVAVPVILLFLIAGYVMRNEAMKRVALYGFAVVGAITLFVALSGFAGQRNVFDELEGSAYFIQRHRNVALPTALLTAALGIWSLLGAFALARRSRRSVASEFKRDLKNDGREEGSFSSRDRFSQVAIALGVITTGSLIWVAERGVQINHPETVKGPAPYERDPMPMSAEMREVENRYGVPTRRGWTQPNQVARPGERGTVNEDPSGATTSGSTESRSFNENGRSK